MAPNSELSETVPADDHHPDAAQEGPLPLVPAVLYGALLMMARARSTLHSTRRPRRILDSHRIRWSTLQSVSGGEIEFRLDIE